MIYFGASYYPEQLDPREVEPDARLMREAGFNLARLGEFAWSRMESADGEFDFDWLEHAVETLARQDIIEIQRTIREIAAVAADIENACPRPEVALLRDFHCDWALDDGHPHPDFRYQRHLYLYYRALFENHVNVEVVHPAVNLADYKLVLAPSLLLMDGQRAAHLRDFVAQGGTLVLTVQSGLRDFDNVFHRQTLPAFLTGLTGIEIEEQNGLPGQDTTGIAPVEGGYAKSRYDCSLLFELLKPITARPLFNYTDFWFAGTSAITVNPFGKGTVYYVATVPSAEFVREFLGKILPQAGVTPNLAASSSPMVESVKSFNGGAEYLHLINYTREPQSVTLPARFQNLGDRAEVSGQFELKPFGAAILKRT